MTIKAALTKYLISVTAVKSLLGTRIYPGTVPQDCRLPYVFLTKISDPRVHTLNSDSGNPKSVRIQISLYAKTETEKDNIVAALETALMDYSGTVTIGSDSFTFGRIYYEGDYDLTDELGNNVSGAGIDITISD